MEEAEALRLVNRKVQLKLTDGKTELSGYVYAVDPINLSLILITVKENDITFQVVPRHAVEEVHPIEEQTIIDLSSIFTKAENILVANKSTVTSSTCEELKTWLKLNRLPFIDMGDIIKVEGVTINPPYSPESCVCDNAIVLSRIQKILEDLSKHRT